MARIGIMVEFRIKPGQWAAFNTAIRAHARRTLDSEPGCLQFDVFQPRTKENAPDHSLVMLCEMYADMAAFDIHRTKPRHPDMAAAMELLEGRKLTICDVE